jgi:histidine ammonia-lyase
MIEIDGRSLTLEDLVAVACDRAPARLAERARPALAASRGVIERALAAEAPVYGVNTGFGELKSRRIAPPDLARLQLNLIRSHAAGVGPALAADEVRALALLRANSLAIGVSGVRPLLVERVLALIEKGVHPVIPEQGSVGASGDLAPLAHFALVLVGEGSAEFAGNVMSGAQALEKAGLEPVALDPKEGLALINGTQLSCAILALTLARGRRVVRAALGACALSIEALLGSVRAFDPRAMAVRAHPGQGDVASALVALTEGSGIVASHADCDRIQDPYSIRCVPQVVGASVDSLRWARDIVEREMNSATDNPLVFADDDSVISSGNFHAQYVGLAADATALALAEVASIAERRLDLLTDAKRSNGLPAFLTGNPGLESGFMLAQYTAAALVSENKTLVHPATADSIPTSAGQEDHVSMAPWGARKARAVLMNTARVVATELLCAAQAIEFRAPLVAGAGTRRVLDAVRTLVPHVAEDTPPGPLVETLARAVLEGRFEAAVAPALPDGRWP